jgi:hypothetical protein
VMPQLFTYVHRAPIILAAARNNVPAVYHLSDFARDGGLLSYGNDVRQSPQSLCPPGTRYAAGRPHRRSEKPCRSGARSALLRSIGACCLSAGIAWWGARSEADCSAIFATNPSKDRHDDANAMTASTVARSGNCRRPRRPT